MNEKNRTHINEKEVYYETALPAGMGLKEIYEALGKNIREERKNRNLSIEVFAEMLELSASYVGLLERGERAPSLDSFLKIMSVLNVSANTLLNFDGKYKVAESDGTRKGKLDTAISLICSLEEEQLDFIISIIFGMNRLIKSSEEDLTKY